MTYKIAFIHIPKTAGASITRWARDNLKQNEYRTLGHKTLSEYLEKYPDFDYETSVTVVRNTYDRMISLYNFKKSKLLTDKKEAEKKELSEKQKEVDFEREAWKKGIVYYIDYCVDQQNRGTFSQLYFIHNVDKLLYYENLNEDFKFIQGQLDCFSPLTQKRHLNLDKTITKVSDDYIRCIKRNFQDELEYFGYSPLIEK